MFLVIALIALTILVTVFLGQHVYYVLVNQTTNERHKMEILVNQPGLQSHYDNNHKNILEKTSKGKTVLNGTSKGPEKPFISKAYRPYDRGLFNNILEVFLPFQFISREKLKGQWNILKVDLNFVF